nr:MAG TPA: hypothetical protein [Caudoviricetes sp.]
MNDLKFKILRVKQNPDVTCILAKRLENGNLITIKIPSINISDRNFIRTALKERYMLVTENPLKEGEII